MKFKPSAYQQAILDAVEKGENNLRVSAVAGSGKTTTLLQIADIYPRGLILAFSRAIADELTSRLPDTDGFSDDGWRAETVHSLGKSVLDDVAAGGGDLDKYLAWNLVDKKLALYNIPWKDKRKIKGEVVKVLSLMKLDLHDFHDKEAISEIIERFGLTRGIYKYQEKEPIHYAHDIVPGILEDTIRIFKTQGKYDFNDMVWLPIILDLDFPKFEKVLVDESQDLNNIHIEIVKKCLAEKSQVVAVGDPYQTIFGFAGANAESYKNIGKAFDCVDMPLSICYRCDVSIVNQAKKLVPHIEARDTASVGETLQILESDVHLFARPGDMVLSRTNAPLLSSAVRAIRSKIKCRIKGLDFAYTLIKQIEDISDKKFSAKATKERIIDFWYPEEYESLIKLEAPDTQFQRLEDIRDAMIVILDTYAHVTDMKLLKGYVTKMFNDGDDSDFLWFSSVHRSKGLEADRVFIITADKLPLRTKNQQSWEFEQELNLKYVAITRAKHLLCVAKKDKFFKGYANVNFIGSSLFHQVAQSHLNGDTEKLEAAILNSEGIKSLESIIAESVDISDLVV